MAAAAIEKRAGERFAVASMTRLSRWTLAVLAVVVVLLALAPLLGRYGLGAAQMRLLGEMFVLLALAQMWNLLAGYGGLVSVGQQAYVGLGAYTFFFFANLWGAHPLLSILEAGLIAGLVAIPTAAVVFRLKGAYFAIGTWVVAEVFRLSFAQMTVFGGGSGRSLQVPVLRSLGGRMELPKIDLPWTAATPDIDFGSVMLREAVIFWCALAVAAGSIALVYVVLRSRFGLALAAIRDSETAAGSLGVDTERAKYVVYITAALVTGLCGALVCLLAGRVAPDASFSVMDWTAFVIFIVVIGGVGRIEGPIVGTIVFFFLQSFLSNLGTAYLIILGLLAAGIMLVAPKGVWGLIVDRFGLELFPIQRRLVTKDGPPS